MSKLSERSVLLAKVESSYGQDIVPTAAANAIAIKEKAFVEFDPEILERKHPLAQRGRIKPLTGKRFAKISFKVDYNGSGTATTAPRIGTLFQACGFGETVGGSDVTYQPVATGMKSLSLYSYIDGLLYKILGAVGNMKISGKSGAPVECAFDLSGVYQDDADSAIVSPTFESNYKTPPQLLSVTFTLDSITTFNLREFNIDLGIPIINREDMVAATGYAGFLVGKQNPTGNLIIEAQAKSVYDFLDKFENATEVQATIVIGSVAGNKFTITIPALTYTNVKVSDQDGLVVLDIPISINMNSANGYDISLKHW